MVSRMVSRMVPRMVRAASPERSLLFCRAAGRWPAAELEEA
jgi:hypothetical protein